MFAAWRGQAVSHHTPHSTLLLLLLSLLCPFLSSRVLRPQHFKAGAGPAAQDRAGLPLQQLHHQQLQAALFRDAERPQGALLPASNPHSSPSCKPRAPAWFADPTARTLHPPWNAQFVLNTSRDVGDLRELLSTLYDDVFVEHVVKSPCYVPGRPFSIQQFNVAVDRFFLQRGLLQLQVG